MTVSLRRATPADASACADIVLALPAYFTPDVPAKVRADLAAHGGWVAVTGGGVVGFAVVERRSSMVAEVLWLAVAPDAQRTGVATRLVDRVFADGAADGVRLVEAKTLDARAGYPPYQATRVFWERSGFVHVDTVDPYPDWTGDTPAAIYVAALDSTVLQ